VVAFVTRCRSLEPQVTEGQGEFRFWAPCALCGLSLCVFSIYLINVPHTPAAVLQYPPQQSSLLVHFPPMGTQSA